MCTICNSRFSLRELLSRDDSLIRFQSGSICHRDCPARVRGRWIDRRLAENVLYAFSVEPKHDRQTLENYLLRYPELADELIDLSHELRLVAELGVLNEHDGNHDSN
jgi:transposase